MRLARALPYAVLSFSGCGRVGFDSIAVADASMTDGDNANLLTNSSFESVDNWPAGWIFQVVSPAAATLSPDMTTAHDGFVSAHASVTAIDGTEFHVQLKQQGIAATAGRTYVYTLWARADAPRSTDITAQLDLPPYTLINSTPIDLTTGWQMFSLTFSPTADATVFVSIMLGFDVGDYWVDDVRLIVM